MPAQILSAAMIIAIVIMVFPFVADRLYIKDSLYFVNCFYSKISLKALFCEIYR